MDVEPSLQPFRLDAELRRVRANVGQRDLGRLLHHVAELSGERQARLAVHPAGLDEQDVAAGARHGQAGRNAGDTGPVAGLEEELRTAQVLADVRGVHCDGRRCLTRRDPGGHLAQHLAQLALEVANPSLPGVVGDDRANRVVGHLDLVVLQAVPFDLTAEQVVAGDRHLLVLRVAVDPDDLHAVQQRPGDRLRHVAGGEEQHLGQVQVDLQVMVAERVVLGRIEDLEQRARGVAAPVRADLVDLVQHEHGVLGPGLLQPSDDPAGQRADVRSPMSPDLGFVVDAAEGHPNELPPERSRDRLAQ